MWLGNWKRVSVIVSIEAKVSQDMNERIVTIMYAERTTQRYLTLCKGSIHPDLYQYMGIFTTPKEKVVELVGCLHLLWVL